MTDYLTGGEKTFLIHFSLFPLIKGFMHGIGEVLSRS
jgi:hypothetical protein